MLFCGFLKTAQRYEKKVRYANLFVVLEDFAGQKMIFSRVRTDFWEWTMLSIGMDNAITEQRGVTRQVVRDRGGG